MLRIHIHTDKVTGKIGKNIYDYFSANQGFLYQQNTWRDVLVAALTLHIFHRHSDSIRMANIAQTKCAPGHDPHRGRSDTVDPHLPCIRNVYAPP